MSQRAIAQVLVVFVGATSLSCSNSSPSGAYSGAGRSGFSLSPPDGTTNPEAQKLFYGADVQIFLPSDSRGGVLDSFANELRLETWPEGEVIPARVQSTEMPGHFVRLQLIPTSVLAERWYAVRVRQSPKELESPTTRLPDGSIGSRFYYGSAPFLLSLEFTPSKNGRTGMNLVFSEKVMLSTVANDNVTGSQAGVDFSWVLDQAYYYPGEPVSGLQSTLWAYSREGGKESESLTVSIPSSFMSPTGKAVGNLPFTQTMMPSPKVRVFTNP